MKIKWPKMILLKQALKKVVININRDLFFCLLLVLVGVVSHMTWFKPGAIVSYGDLTFRYDEFITELRSGFNTWLSYLDFGQTNVQIYFFVPYVVFWWFGAQIGVSFTELLKVTHLIPISILGFITPYFLIKNFTSNRLIACACGLFYGSTTIFLSRQAWGHLPIALIFSIIPLLLLLFIKALTENNWRSWLIFAIIYSCSFYFEARVMYLVSLIFFIYYFWFGIWHIKKHWVKLLVTAILIILLNFFWLFPLAQSSIFEDINNLLERGVFGDTLYTLTQSFTLFDYSWTGDKPDNTFTRQPILWYFWFLPFIALYPLLLKKTKDKSLIIFFSLLSLLGIFLTKQSAAPFPHFYDWAYKNIPTFNIFRSASKFYIITALSYTVLIGLTLKQLRIKSRYIFGITLLIAVLTSVTNLKPLINGSFQTITKERFIEDDYIKIKELISKDPYFYRTLWLPIASNWSFKTMLHPAVSATNAKLILSQSFDSLVTDLKKPVEEQLMSFLNNPNADALFDQASIKYIFVPTEDRLNDGDFFVYYGGTRKMDIRDWYITQLDKISWIKRIDVGTKEIVAYENIDYNPLIYLTTGYDYVATGQTDFINSGIRPVVFSPTNDFNLNTATRVIFPIAPSQENIRQLQKVKNQCEIQLCVQTNENLISEYVRGGFFKDFSFSVDAPGLYNIYFKNTIGLDFKELRMVLDENFVYYQKQDDKQKDQSQYEYFNSIEFDNKIYKLSLYQKQKKIDFLDPDSLIFVKAGVEQNQNIPVLTNYQQYSSAKYFLNLESIKDSFGIVFSQSFHPDWALTLKTVDDKKIKIKNHAESNGFQNFWWIDVAELEQTGIHKNTSDGTYDFQIILEFMPQKYFYIGLFISAFTLIGCLGYLGYDFYKTRTNKKIAPLQ